MGGWVGGWKGGVGGWVGGRTYSVVQAEGAEVALAHRKTEEEAKDVFEEEGAVGVGGWVGGWVGCYTVYIGGWVGGWVG